jgi:hypothetical protein
MPTIWGLVLLSGLYPLAQALRANRRTSLVHAIFWTLGAWTGWSAVALGVWLWPWASLVALRYLAVSLTACAGMAVLGARRPTVNAWNFVVFGLLAVLLLPLAQGLGNLRHSLLQAGFLASTLAVGVLNYLPTRLAPAALCVAAGCAVDILRLADAPGLNPVLDQLMPAGELLLAASPWAAYTVIRWRTPPLSEFDRIWLDFRDRFGLLWGQRLREQFNRAAANAGWPVYLRWQGLRLTQGASLPGPAAQDQILDTLRALLKRFGPD